MWEDLEPTAGAFDFSSVVDALERVHANGQRLTLQILGTEPDHVIAEADETWRWHDTNPRHTGPCTVAPGCLRSLPWDGPSLDRQEALIAALADAPVDTPAGPVRLADHPALDQVLLPLVGWGRIRELGVEVEDWPGYTRARLRDATLAVVRMHHRHFPALVHQVQLFRVSDDGTDGLWQDLARSIVDGLAADGSPAPIFLMENLVHANDGALDTYRPGPTMAAEPLVFAADQGAFVGFQMLTSWARPFPGQEAAVAGGSPAAAIDWARATFGARYFEIYPPDVDAAEAGDGEWATLRAELVAAARPLCP